MTDRDDLAERLDAVGEALDEDGSDPFFVFRTEDGDYVDRDGNPVPTDENGNTPGVFLIPNSVTDKWGRL